MLLSILPASAYDFKVDGLCYDVVSFTDFTCEVVKDSVEYEGDVKIPSTVSYNNRELSVIAIGRNAFYDCHSLTSVDIPNSVTSIDYHAFAHCSLTSIKIPNSVTSIGEEAFYGCSSLTSVDIPNSVTSIDSFAFYGCRSLTSIKIPNSVTYIDSYVFYGCSSLTSIEIPNSVKSIGYYAFYGCSSLTSLDIPNSVTSIGSYAFYGCSSLTSLDIPNSVTSIGSYAFRSCSSLESIKLSDNLETIATGLFTDCSSLSSLVIPASVNRINLYYETIEDESYLFSGCSNLRELEIEYSPNEIKYMYYNYSIREYIDYNTNRLYYLGNVKKTTIPLEKITLGRRFGKLKLPDLKELVLGEHLDETSVDLNVDSLQTITSLSATPPNLNSNITNKQYMEMTVRVPIQYLETYKSAKQWKNFWNLEGFEGFEPTEPSGISDVTPDNGVDETGRYNLNGQPVGQEYKGIVIVRYADGSAQKMVQR